jgi:MFS family permease
MASTEPERENTRVISRENFLSIYLPAITLALGTGIATPALPVYARTFNVDAQAASLVFAIHLLGNLVMTLPTGFLLDRFGRRKIVLAGPILVGVTSLMVAFAQSFPELLAYRFLGGCAQAMWMLGRLAMISDTGGDRQRGRQITGMVGMETTGRLAGPAVGGFLAAWGGISAPFIAHAILSVVAVIPSFKLLKESAPAGAVRRSGHGAADDGPVSGRAALTAMLTGSVLAFFLAQFLASLTRGTLFGGTIHLYPVYHYGMGPEAIGLITTIGTALGLPIVFSTGAIMDKFGRKMTIVPGFTILAIMFCIITWTAVAGLPFEAYAVAYVCMQLGQNLTSGNMQVIGSDIAPAHFRGRFFAVWRLINESGSLLSPLIFGFLAVNQGYPAAFIFLAIASGITALVLAFLVKDPLKTKPSEPQRRSEPAPEPKPATATA